MRKGESGDDEAEPLSEADLRALRGSRFAALPSLPSPSRSQPRLAHPGGPMKTNKAAALAKFLERKLQEPGGLSSINPDLLEQAVKNAKDTLRASSSSETTVGRIVQHVDSFGDPEYLHQDETENQDGNEESRKKKRKKQKNKKGKKKKAEGCAGTAESSRRKKKKLKTRSPASAEY